MAYINGIFRAKVVNNDQFTLIGKVEVVVYGITVGDNVTKLAEILTPYGGLPNMGMVSVPAPGTTGFVFFERGDKEICVWMGGVLAAIDNKFEDFNKECDENYARPVEVESPGDFVIKTQNTTLEKQDLDDNNNKVENIIKMNKTEFTLAKINQSDNNYEYKKEAYDLKESKAPYQIISMTDDNITIKYKPTNTSDNNYVILKMDSTGTSVTQKDDSGERTMNVTSEGVVVNVNSNAKMTFHNDGSIDVEGEIIHLLGDTKWATLYEGFRDFVNNVFMNHQHGSGCGGTKGTVIANPDTTLSKSTKVKLS